MSRTPLGGRHVQPPSPCCACRPERGGRAELRRRDVTLVRPASPPPPRAARRPRPRRPVRGLPAHHERTRTRMAVAACGGYARRPRGDDVPHTISRWPARPAGKPPGADRRQLIDAVRTRRPPRGPLPLCLFRGRLYAEPKEQSEKDALDGAYSPSASRTGCNSARDTCAETGVTQLKSRGSVRLWLCVYASEGPRSARWAAASSLCRSGQQCSGRRTHASQTSI